MNDPDSDSVPSDHESHEESSDALEHVHSKVLAFLKEKGSDPRYKDASRIWAERIEEAMAEYRGEEGKGD